jgi:signal transduction histidine kinase
MTSLGRTGTVLVGSMIDSSLTGIDERFLGSLALAAKAMASGDLSRPVPVVGRDELSELRTPVTLIQGTIEGMIDGVFPLDIDTLRELEIIESGELVLAIASEIVKAHGGSIAIGDSDLGGASFVVTLPRHGS